ncbi:MAG: trigger factor [Candidatus Aminicenantes bacterium]
MKSHVKKLGECKREIEVEVEKEKVMKEFHRIVARYSRQAKIPGFRPGKAPEEMVKRMFYPQIKDSLISDLVPKALQQELRSQNLNPIATPVLNHLHFEEGEPLHFKAQFEIWPEVPLPDYKKERVKRKKISVTEEEVNQALEELRLNAAQYIPVENRGVADGDYVVAEMRGRDTGTKRYFPKEKIIMVAGDTSNEEELNQNLSGLKPGQDSNFVIAHSQDHPNKKLAGKEVEYNLKVISIKERRVPQINDDFARDLGDYENLKSLRKEVKEKIKQSKQKEARKEMAEDIIKNISKKISFEIPESIIEAEYKAVLNRLLSSSSSQNLNQEEKRKLKIEARKKAQQNLKNHLIWRRIAENENIEVSEEDVHQEMKSMAEANNLPLAKVVETINKEGKREELKNTILYKKTVDFLVNSAIIE